MEKNKSLFERIETKIKRRTIMQAVIIGFFGIVLVVLGFANGFSSELAWKIGPRYSDVGIPLPNWLISLGFIALAIFFIYVSISAVKSVIKNTEFTNFMILAEQLGNVKAIEESLSKTEKCPYAKGELRCNENYMFYMKDTDIKFIKTDSILAVRPIVEQHKNSKSYYVVLHYKNANNDVIKIGTTNKNISLLAKFITEFVLADRCEIGSE